MGNTSSEEQHLMNKTASGREPLKSKRLLFVRRNCLNIETLFVLFVPTDLYIIHTGHSGQIFHLHG